MPAPVKFVFVANKLATVTVLLVSVWVAVLSVTTPLASGNLMCLADVILGCADKKALLPPGVNDTALSVNATCEEKLSASPPNLVYI